MPGNPAAAESRQRLKKAAVAQADARQAAQNKNGKRVTVKTGAESVRPNGEEPGCQTGTSKIGFHAADLRGRAMAANCGNGKRQRG